VNKPSDSFAGLKLVTLPLAACVSLTVFIAGLARGAGTPGALVEYAVRFDGSGLRQVGGAGPVLNSSLGLARYDFSASLQRSPGGRWFAYIDQGRLYVGDTSAMSLTDSRPVTANVAHFTVMFPGSAAAPRMFSPDGRSIAFAVTRNGPSTEAIYFARTDGTGLREIVAAGRDPSWSSDGSSLLFTRGSGPRRAIYTVRAGGGVSGRLAFGHGGVADPTGRRVAFVSNAGTATIVNQDGTHRFRLGQGLGDFVWSLDGRELAWVDTKTEQLQLATADSGWKSRPLVRSALPLPLAFSPDGRRLAYLRGFSLFTVTTNGRARPHLVATGLVAGVHWTSNSDLTYLGLNS
jgi:WD40-like Beta Propeller Repeat